MKPSRSHRRLTPFLMVAILTSSCSVGESTLPLFETQRVPISSFSGEDLETKALTALAMISEFCTNDSSKLLTSADRPNWALGCNGACGLQANYLIAFLGEWGFNARLISFYNVPNQGNHTAVEVHLEESWRLLDPTFGLLFTNSKHELASTDEVLNGEAFARTVGPTSALQFLSDTSYFGDQPNLGELEDMFWSPENYGKAEAVFPVGLDPLPEVSLRIGVPIDGNFPSPERCEKAGLQCDSEWLDATNRTLQNTNPADDVSLLSRNVGEYAPYFINSPHLYLTSAAPEFAAQAHDNGHKLNLNVSVYFDRPVGISFSWGSRSRIVQTSGEFNSASVIVDVETARETGISVSVTDSESARILYLESALVEGTPDR